MFCVWLSSCVWFVVCLCVACDLLCGVAWFAVVCVFFWCVLDLVVCLCASSVIYGVVVYGLFCCCCVCLCVAFVAY